MPPAPRRTVARPVLNAGLGGVAVTNWDADSVNDHPQPDRNADFPEIQAVGASAHPARARQRTEEATTNPAATLPIRSGSGSSIQHCAAAAQVPADLEILRVGSSATAWRRQIQGICHRTGRDPVPGVQAGQPMEASSQPAPDPHLILQTHDPSQPEANGSKSKL